MASGGGSYRWCFRRYEWYFGVLRKSAVHCGTLATMVAWRETLRWVTNGAWIEGLPNTFQWFGFGQRTGEAVILVSALLLFGVLWWTSRNLAAVRAIYATGSDAEAARLAGLPTNQVVLWGICRYGSADGYRGITQRSSLFRRAGK